MTIPDYETLMLPVLKLSAKGEIRIRDCIESLTIEYGLTEEEQNQLLPSGKQTTFANRVHWARTYLVQAGLLEATRRGHVQATDRGRDVLASNLDRVDNTVLLQFPEFRDFRARRRTTDSEPVTASPTSSPVSDDGSTPEEAIELAYAEILEDLRSQPNRTYRQCVTQIL